MVKSTDLRFIDSFLNNYTISEKSKEHIEQMLIAIVDKLRGSQLQHGSFVTSVVKQNWFVAEQVADGINKIHIPLYKKFIEEVQTILKENKMKPDAKYISEKRKMSQKLMSEAVKYQERKKIQEQADQRDKVTFKFEFVGITAGDSQKIYLKFNSPALSLALMNNKAKGGAQKYAYLSNFVQIARNTLQTQTGINPLQFESQKSVMGDLIFSVSRQLAKTDLSQLIQLNAISVVVKVTDDMQQQPEQPQQTEPTAQPQAQAPVQQVPQKQVAQPNAPVANVQQR